MGLFGGNPDPTFRIYMVIAAVGTVLAAGYLLWMYQRVAFGEPKAEFADAHIHDVNIVEWIAWTPMLHRHPGARHLPRHHLQRHGPDRDPPDPPHRTLSEP